MRLNLKSFEACIECIAAGMDVDEGAGEHSGEAGAAVDRDIALDERRLLASGPIIPEDQEELARTQQALVKA